MLHFARRAIKRVTSVAVLRRWPALGEARVAVVEIRSLLEDVRRYVAVAKTAAAASEQGEIVIGRHRTRRAAEATCSRFIRGRNP